MSLFIIVYWFLVTRWDRCYIENRKIINVLFGFIPLRKIRFEDIKSVETDSEIKGKQAMQRHGVQIYNYLRITYNNKQKNKDLRYIITPDDDWVFKSQIQLMQKDTTIQTFIEPKKLVANFVILSFSIITIIMSCLYASESFEHPIITFSSFALVFVIHRYIIIRTINKLLYDDYRNNLEKYAIRN